MRYRLAACLLWFAAPPAALAGSLTLLNCTDLVAYEADAPTAYFPGPNPYVAQQAIGSEFTTTSLTVQADDQTDGSVLVSFDYLTQFPGSETISGVAVDAADILLQPVSAGTANGTFSYGISLGYQLNNGGLEAGFYQVQSTATSQSIWSARAGFIYGGAIATSTQFLPGEPGFTASLVPTVITGGTRLGNALVLITGINAGWYDIDASIDMTAQQAALFASGFDVLWGTGDCGNGAFLADVPELPVMEPASFVLLTTALSFSVLGRASVGRRSGRRKKQVVLF